MKDIHQASKDRLTITVMWGKKYVQLIITPKVINIVRRYHVRPSLQARKIYCFMEGKYSILKKIPFLINIAVLRKQNWKELTIYSQYYDKCIRLLTSTDRGYFVWYFEKGQFYKKSTMLKIHLCALLYIFFNLGCRNNI